MSSVASINKNLRALCKKGCLKEAVDTLLATHNTQILSATYVHLLQGCITKKALSEGKKIHSHIKDRGYILAEDTFLQNTIINMYDKCGSLLDASNVFNNMIEPNVVSFNLTIAAYRKHGFHKEALALFHKLEQLGIQPSDFTISSILSMYATTGSLNSGLQIHGKVIRCGFHFNVFVLTALIDMYTKCKSLNSARQLFDNMPQRNVVSWTAIISGYAQVGLADEALDTFKQMQFESIEPNVTTFASILPACAKLGALAEGKEIHQKIVELGFTPGVIALNALMDMYAKCGSIHNARKLFDKMPERSVVTWNTIITGYEQNGLIDEAFKLFKDMPQPNVISWTAIIAGCAQNGLGALAEGKEIHQKIMELGFTPGVIALNALMNMYAKCGSIHNARKLFDKMPERSVVTWNAIITGYAQNGFIDEALKLFKDMPQPNVISWTAIIAGCAQTGRALAEGKEIHQKIMELGFTPGVIVLKALMDMYAKCGSIHNARKLFDKMPERSVVTWNAIIRGYAQNGFIDEALKLFKDMPQPNVISWTAIIAGCAQNGIGALAVGKEIHQKIMELGFTPDVIALNALMDMYAKCGSIHNARKLFDKMPERSVVTWNAIITGYAKNGFINEAFKLFKDMPQPNVISWTAIIAGCAQNALFDKALENFKQMQSAGIKPDSATFASILPACAKLGALKMGMEIQQKVIESGACSNVVATALIDMYAKCGNIQKARNVFDKMHHIDVITWNAMTSGYSMHGYSEDTLELLQQLKHSPAIISDVQ